MKVADKHWYPGYYPNWDRDGVSDIYIGTATKEEVVIPPPKITKEELGGKLRFHMEYLGRQCSYELSKHEAENMDLREFVIVKMKKMIEKSFLDVDALVRL